MTYSAADFLSLFQQLLPRGRVWPRSPDALQTKAFAALMPTYARLAERDDNLLIDGFPTTTDELLPEWELSLGLPDPCAGESATIEQRRAQVVARFTNTGGQSIPYFIGYAATLGYDITVTQFAPAVAGGLRAGQPVRGLAWAFAWQVNAPGITTTQFRAGQSAAGEPLQVFGNDVLRCELAALAPAHTTVLFSENTAGISSIGEFAIGLDAFGG